MRIVVICEANTERVTISVRHVTLMTVKATTAPLLIVKQLAHKCSHRIVTAACMTSIPVVWGAVSVQCLEFVWQNGDGNISSSWFNYHCFIAFSKLSGRTQKPALALHPAFSSITFHERLTWCYGAEREIGFLFLNKTTHGIKVQMWTLIYQMLIFGVC